MDEKRFNTSSESIYDLMTVGIFCKRHCMGKSKFYAMLKAGQGPRTLLIGGQRLISVEAAREWRAKFEDPSSASAA